MQAFSEDKLALEAIEALDDTDPTPGFVEVSVGSDSSGVQMRRILQRKALEEERMRAAKLGG